MATETVTPSTPGLNTEITGEGNVAPEVPKTRRERGTGRLWQIGKIWYVQYYVNGRQVRECSHSEDEKDAKKLLRKRLGEAAAGIHRELRRLTYEDLRRGLMDNYIIKKQKSFAGPKRASRDWTP